MDTQIQQLFWNRESGIGNRESAGSITMSGASIKGDRRAVAEPWPPSGKERKATEGEVEAKGPLEAGEWGGKRYSKGGPLAGWRSCDVIWQADKLPFAESVAALMCTDTASAGARRHRHPGPVALNN